MATKANYENSDWVLKALADAQEADHDRREKAREAHEFVDAPDGQWEDRWKEINDKAPRYTFDMVTSLVDQIHGQMARTDYDIKVRPAGGAASKETATTFDGMVRNIENISDADQVYDQAGLEFIICGVDGWEVTTDYVDGDSFNQDLFIKAIPDYLDSTWLGPHKTRDGSDAKYGFVLRGLAPDVFKTKYPSRGEGGSVGSDRTTNTYYHREDVVMVGEFRYMLPVEHEIALMDTGEVIAVDKDFPKAYAALQRGGSTFLEKRKRTKLKMFSRLFDNNGWINKKPRPTFFENWLNIIPCYANWKYIQNKVIYKGQIEQGMDAQRVLNYSLSREVAETSLAPKDFFWHTDKQAEGQDWSDLNVSQSPAHAYTHDEDAPGAPMRSGGAQPNAGLARITESMQGIIGASAGMFHASQGDNPGLQSGLAIEKLQDKGDDGNNKYMVARKIAQRHTGRILVNTIPRVYDAGRQVRILGEDGAFDMTTIGEKHVGPNGDVTVVNDLTAGDYDVVCSIGPSFKSRQNETVSAITAIAQVSPEVLQLGGDVLMNNMDSPGMDQLGERARRRLLKAGDIPEDQMTDAEKEEAMANAQQPPQPDPMMVAAEAEASKGRAAETAAQTKQIEAQGNIQIKMKELEISAKELQVREFEALTDRFEAQVKAGDSQAAVALKGAQAAKALADAEGKDIENSATTAGIVKLVADLEALQGSAGVPDV
jgi:hypothetical protein